MGNFVPQYLQNHVSRTLETMYHVPQARNHVPSTLDITYVHQKYDKKMELLKKIKLKSLCFLVTSYCVFSITQPEGDKLEPFQCFPSQYSI